MKIGRAFIIFSVLALMLTNSLSAEVFVGTLKAETANVQLGARNRWQA